MTPLVLLIVLRLLTYLLSPWRIVLHDKLTCLQLETKFPTFSGTRQFITAFTSARHLSLSWASSIQSITSNPISWRSIVLLSSHLRLGIPSCLFPSGFPTKILHTPLLSPRKCYMPRPSQRSILLLSSHVRLSLTSCLFLSRFLTKFLHTPLASPNRATCPVHLILLDLITRTILGEQYRSRRSSLHDFQHSPVSSSLVGSNNILKYLDYIKRIK